MKVKDEILQVCNKMAQEVPCEFVGLAVYHSSAKEIRWHVAIGNRNDKYKRIIVRYGKGIAGQVIRNGRPMTVIGPFDQRAGKQTEYPILIAEQLLSAYAVPVSSHGIPWGVLLIGNRSGDSFQTTCTERVKQAAWQIEDLLKTQGQSTAD